MSRTFSSLGVVVAALALAATAFAAPVQAKRPAKPAAHSVVGTLEKYDASANTIVVNTGKATDTVTLTSDSAIRMGASKMTASDLTAHAGQRVKVRYMESNGQKTAQSVQIQGSAPKQQARAQASSAKPAAKK